MRVSFRVLPLADCRHAAGGGGSHRGCVELSLVAFAALCARCLSSAHPDETARDHLNAAGLWSHDELSESGRRFAHPIRTAVTYFRAVTVECGWPVSAGLGSVGAGDAGRLGLSSGDVDEASGAEFYVWVSLSGVTCVRVEAGGALMWLLDPCEVLPLFAEILGIRPGYCLTEEVPRSFAAVAFEALAGGRFEDFAQILRSYGEPFVTDRDGGYVNDRGSMGGATDRDGGYVNDRGSMGDVTDRDGDSVTDRAEDWCAEDRYAKDGCAKDRQAGAWRAAYVERLDTVPGHPTVVHEASRRVLAYLATPTQLFAVHGLPSSLGEGEHNDTRTSGESGEVVLLTPTVPLLEWSVVSSVIAG